MGLHPRFHATCQDSMVQHFELAGHCSLLERYGRHDSLANCPQGSRQVQQLAEWSESTYRTVNVSYLLEV